MKKHDNLRSDSPFIWIVAVVFVVAVAYVAYSMLAANGIGLQSILNPKAGLAVPVIIAIALILGMLHGITPDEHTWPITFSYAIGSYSTQKGMKAGLTFSAGFTLQRAILTTLGFMGLASVYTKYNLDGPVYIIVGIAMAIAGMYILNKKQYLHIHLDSIFNKVKGHSRYAEVQDRPRDVPLKLAALHGFIAGFGFGAYATIITFVLAPQMPSIWYAPLPGLFFGIGTMMMQIVEGGLFANFARAKKLKEEELVYVGRKTAGRTLYYGGILFSVIGLLIVFFPYIDSVAVSTGNPIPNLDSIGVATVLVLVVVGVVGIGSLIKGIREVSKLGKQTKKNNIR